MRTLVALLASTVAACAQFGGLGDPAFVAGLTVPTAAAGGGSPEYSAHEYTVITVATDSPTVTYPSVSANDIMLVVFVTDSNHTLLSSPPSGWTVIETSEIDIGTDSSLSVFWRRATGSEGASETWTTIFNSSEVGQALCIAYSGCATSGDPFDDTSATTAGPTTNWDIASVTSTDSNRLIVGIFGCDPGGTYTFSADGTDTLRTESSDASNQSFIAVLERAEASAGTYTVGGTTSSDTYGAIGIALKP